MEIVVKPYTRIFKADHDKALECDSASLLVYLALCRIHSDAPPEEKSGFKAGAARVARHCGLSRRTIQKCLPRLANEGLIVIKSGRRKDRKSDHEENRITLTGSAESALPSAASALGSATECGNECARIKKAPKGAKKDARFAGGVADATSASGQAKSTNSDFDYL